jgi:hypothetical protein
MIRCCLLQICGRIVEMCYLLLYPEAGGSKWNCTDTHSIMNFFKEINGLQVEAPNVSFPNFATQALRHSSG